MRRGAGDEICGRINREQVMGVRVAARIGHAAAEKRAPWDPRAALVVKESAVLASLPLNLRDIGWIRHGVLPVYNSSNARQKSFSELRFRVSLET
jgi:hypothetical protein